MKKSKLRQIIKEEIEKMNEKKAVMASKAFRKAMYDIYDVIEKITGGRHNDYRINNMKGMFIVQDYLNYKKGKEQNIVNQTKDIKTLDELNKLIKKWHKELPFSALVKSK